MNKAAQILIGSFDHTKNRYRCPWSSICFQDYKVDKKLRRDFILTPEDLQIELESSNLLFSTCTSIKRSWFDVVRKYNKIRKATTAIDPTKLNYDGWEVIPLISISYRGSKYTPWSKGFALAIKNIPKTGLISISIAIFVKR